MSSFVSHRAQVLAALDSAAERAMLICGAVAEGHAKDVCPVDTGRLRASISHAVPDPYTAVVGTNVEYAAYVELGTSRQRPKPYLRPAVENHFGEYKAIVENELKKG